MLHYSLYPAKPKHGASGELEIVHGILPPYLTLANEECQSFKKLASPNDCFSLCSQLFVRLHRIKESDFLPT